MLEVTFTQRESLSFLNRQHVDIGPGCGPRTYLWRDPYPAGWLSSSSPQSCPGEGWSDSPSKHCRRDRDAKFKKLKRKIHIHNFTGVCNVLLRNSVCLWVLCGHSHIFNLSWQCGSLNPTWHHLLVCGLMFWKGIIAIAILPFQNQKWQEGAHHLGWLDLTENPRIFCSSDKAAWNCLELFNFTLNGTKMSLLLNCGTRTTRP